MLRISLQIQILIGMLLGIAFGLFFGEMTLVLDSLGQAFIMLLKMTILPYLSISLIHGIGSLSLSTAKDLLRKGIGIIFLFWGIIIAIIYTLILSFPKFTSAQFHSDIAAIDHPPQSMLQLLIPTNPFSALANNLIPAVVLFSLLFGIALMQLRSKSNLLGALETTSSALMSITRWVSQLSPIGVFALVATTAGTITFNELGKIGYYLVAYLVCSLILALWVFPSLVVMFTPVSYRRFLSGLRPALLLAFTTANVLIIIPFVVEFLKLLSEESRIGRKESHNTIGAIVPVIYNFPSAGNLLTLLFLLFLSFFYARPMALSGHFDLIISGVFALFGSASATINAVSFLLDRMRLPSDGLSLYLATMALTRHFQALVSCAGLATVAILLHFSCQKVTKFNRKKGYLGVGVTFLLLGIALFGIKRLPFGSGGGEEVFSSLEIKEQAESTLFRDPPPNLNGKGIKQFSSTFERIKQTATLRVGYNLSPRPFVYFNNKDQLVGFDIAFAHKLAQDLGCKIEFIPFEYDHLVSDLENNRFDIAMSGVSVTEERLKNLRFSEPYMATERSFIVKDHRRQEFLELDDLKEGNDLKVAVLKGSSFEALARKAFPKAELVLLEDYRGFFEEDEEADLLYWSREEGLTWALTYPDYTVITPTPSLGQDFLAYAVNKDSLELLEYINYWLDLKKLDGFAEKLYKQWVQGEVDDSEPRWSIIRNKLHWID